MERLALSNSAFEGDNNAYLFDGDETVLIDTGDWTDPSREQLQGHLAEHDITFGDIDTVLLTHWHHDHTGLAGAIQDASGATVYCHPNDALLVEGDEDAWDEFHARLERYYEKWRMPEDERSVIRDRMGDPANRGMSPDVQTFEDGDTFSFDDVELEVVHTSGHADGLCVFEWGADVFSGDALLPVYTPNVGGADVRVDRPLEKYLRALEDIVDADYDRAWPGHRDPIEDPTGRAADIIEHHEERAWRVLDTLRRIGPCTTWEVSAELFGELDDIHILHGPGESYAHLEHLERRGIVDTDGVRYSLTDDTAERLQSLDDDRWELT